MSWSSGATRGTLYGDIALVVLFAMLAVERLLEWRQGTMPRWVRYVLPCIAAACLVIIVSSSIGIAVA